MDFLWVNFKSVFFKNLQGKNAQAYTTNLLIMCMLSPSNIHFNESNQGILRISYFQFEFACHFARKWEITLRIFRIFCPIVVTIKSKFSNMTLTLKCFRWKYNNLGKPGLWKSNNVGIWDLRPVKYKFMKMECNIFFSFTMKLV